MPICRTALCALAVCLTAGPLAIAGDLTPPGAPASTMKTLDVVEPRIPVGPLTTPGDADSIYRITEPGSYFLTSNIAGASGKHGVEIASDDVSLDMMGLSAIGVSGSLSGVFASIPVNGVRIEHGTIRGWGGAGVNLLDGDLAVIRDVIAENNGAGGIYLGDDAIIVECIALGNSGDGFIVALRAVVRDSIAEGNADNGFQVLSNAVIRDCVAEDNAGSGFFAGLGSIVAGVTSRGNAINGVYVAGNGSIHSSSAYSNTNDGFASGAGVRIVDCTANFNGADGIDVSDGCEVRGNTLYANSVNGIEVNGDCLIIDNKIDNAGNGPLTGAGVHAIGSDNRIEGNSITDSDIGIRAPLSGNLVVRNSLAGNSTHFDLVTGNKVGVIVVAPSSGVVSGVGGAAGVGTTDPWANLVY